MRTRALEDLVWDRMIPSNSTIHRSLFFFFFFKAYLFIGQVACGVLFSWPGIESAPPALEAWSLNHQTAREVALSLLTLKFSR